MENHNNKELSDTVHLLILKINQLEKQIDTLNNENNSLKQKLDKHLFEFKRIVQSSKW